MMHKLLSLTASVALFTLVNTAYAAQPLSEKHPHNSDQKKIVALSDKQMDHVTAGSFGIANVGAVAIGEVDAVTFTQSSTFVDDIAQIAVSQAFGQALAAGGFLYNAAAISHSDTSAGIEP